MPEDTTKAPAPADGGGEAPQYDHFGEPIKNKNAPIEEKKEEQKLDKDGKPIVEPKKSDADDISKHPSYVALKNDLDTIKKDLGGNLGNQGKIIKNLTAQLEALQKGGSKAAEAAADMSLYKDIKRAKDLPQKERDEMTETEIKQFDEIADLKDGLNKLAKMIGEKGAPAAKTAEEIAAEAGEGAGKKDDGTVDDVETVDDLGRETRAAAMELAGHDIDLANKIVHEFNQFAGNDKLNQTQLAERLGKAAKLVPEYKASREAPSRTARNASAVKTGAGGNEDPFGTKGVIEAVAASKKAGGYKL